MNGTLLKEKLKAEGISLSAVARKMGYKTDQNLHSVLGAADVKSSVIERMSVAIGKPIGWFYGEQTETESRPYVYKNNSVSFKQLPLLQMEAVAGYGQMLYEDDRDIDYYTVREFSESDFLIRVKGDSMTPKFNGGDIVACKKVTDLLFFQWNRVYVIYTKSQGVMIKRVQQSENSGCIKCVSDNEKYAPFDVPKEDVISIALVNGSISLE